MMKFICNKRCRFGDKDYIIGEEIPSELIEHDRIPALLKYGTIVTVDVPDGQIEKPTPDDEPDNKETQSGEQNDQPDGDELESEPPVKSAEPAKKTNGKKGDK